MIYSRILKEFPEITLTFNIISDPKHPNSISLETIYFIPYTSANNQSRIHILHAGSLYIQKIGRGGTIATGKLTVTFTEKDMGVLSSEDTITQADGYASLLRMADGQPTSIAIASNTEYLTLEALLELCKHYHRESVTLKMNDRTSYDASAIEDTTMINLFNPLTATGLKRIISNSSVTVFYSLNRTLIDHASMLTHPNTRNSAKELKLRTLESSFT